MQFNLRFTRCRVLLFCLLLTLTVFAQQKAPITPADYGKWETLGAGELSPDGQWLAYGLNRVNGTNELRIRSLTGDAALTAPFGSNPTFSDDGRWAAYSIGYSEQERERLTKARKPVQNKLGLLNLTTRETVVIESVASFAFSKGGKFLAMRRYPPQRAESAPPSEGGEAGGDRESPGVDLIVRDLAKGTDTNFGNVSGFVWQDGGALLALTINAEGRAGNGVQVFDPATGMLRVLDSGAAIYTGLAWRKESSDLAVLRSKKQDGYEEETFALLAWKDLAGAKAEKKVFDHTADASFPKDTRVVRYRAPSWADTGSALFIGIKEWTKKPSAREGRNNASAEDEEPAGVEVWHARDVNVIPEQKLRAESDRQKNLLAVWHWETGRFVKLAQNPNETVTPIKGGKQALSRDNTPYQTDGMFGRQYNDLYLVDISTGERKPVLQRLNSQASASSGGRYLIYFKANHYWTYDLKTGAHTNITKAATTASSFDNREDDHPVEQKSPYGIAGWTKDDSAVIVYDQFDLWEVKPDGSKATRLTNGVSEEIRHRYARLDPREEFIDPAKPMYLSLYGQWTKRSGYARTRLGGQTERLVFLDKGVARLARAKDADVFAYVAQAFDDSPDYFVGGADLKDARQITATNAFQSNYAWGRTQLIDYKNKRGERLQGILHYPAGYQAGKQYPMIVYIYEKLSQGLHSYSVPSERSAYNPAVFTSRGYFVLQPDIAFRERDPGGSIVECVTVAVGKALESGMIDRQHLGIVGHSWGGYGTAYLASFSNLFTAAVAGAPLTDLVSMYGSVYWNTGGPETNHFEVGQERMQVPLWEDREAYLRNSPISNVHQMKTPLLMTFGDKDGAVDWHQGLEMYNMARRAGKDFVLLVYPGENHSLAKKPNQVDYHRRIIEWFGHYLQGAPAPAWMTKGVSHLEREAELKRLKDQKAVPKPSVPPAGSSIQQ